MASVVTVFEEFNHFPLKRKVSFDGMAAASNHPINYKLARQRGFFGYCCY
jgi:hypothetical protein